MQKVIKYFVFFTLGLVLCGCVRAVKTEQAKDEYESFATDGRGGLYFEGRLRTQKVYPGVTDTITQGNINSHYSFFYILHYPQGLGKDADEAVADFAKKIAGEYVFALTQGVPYDDFFSSTYVRAEVIAAHAKEQAKRSAEEIADEEAWAFQQQIFPIYISYEITEAPGAFSVNFSLWAYAGGAHDNWKYRAITIDKSSGKALTFKTLFNAPKSLARTEHWMNTTDNVGYYYQGSCMTNESTFEHTNINLQSQAMEQKGFTMERFIVTHEGLEAVFAPYEQGSFAQGDVHATIPLAKFKSLGINQRYWQLPITSKK